MLKLNNRGFAISGILYSILILFLLLLVGILGVLGSRKVILDKTKNDVFNKLNDINITSSSEVKTTTPHLEDNMIPIIYKNNNWYVASSNEEWYNYNDKKWGNAIVVDASVYSTYQTKSDAIDVTSNDIKGMFVWIPRYKYKLFNAENSNVNEQEIEIDFVDPNTTKSNGSTNGQWLTHPAFTFGNEELSGFWISKFEVTNTTSNIAVKPNQTALKEIPISTMYNTVRGLDNTWGMTDVHLLKNTEWGAVAYLNHSKYGTCTDGVCTEIGINNNSTYTTGCGAAAGSAGTSACNSYDTTNGMLASTTGNIYGVYDMSGGTWEYVMGVQYNSSSNTNLEIGSSGFSQSVLDGIENKYIDKYNFGTDYVSFQRGKLGDATREILKSSNGFKGSWYDDFSFLAYQGSPWILRGGFYDYNINAGIFSFCDISGAGFNHSGFRLSIPGV